MRAQAQKIALLVAVGLIAPVAPAFAGSHPHKPTVSAAPRLKQRPGSREPVFAATASSKAGRHAPAAETHVRGGHAGHQATAETRRHPNKPSNKVASRSAKAAPAKGRHAAAEPRPAHGRRVAPVPSDRPMYAAEVRHSRAPKALPAPEPQIDAPAPQAEPDESIHVKHDRKQHLTPEAEVPDPSKAYTIEQLSNAWVAPPPGDRIGPTLYDKRGRLVMPAALRGSHEILVHQNLMADMEGLDRVRDDVDLERMRESKLLVPIPAVAGMQTDGRLPANRSYCRPWTAQFLAELARAHYARFHTRLQVNSAVRTVEFQQQLIHRNGNAAPAEGETASPHLTGQAVDLAKKGLSLTEIAWLRGYLLPLVEAGKVDVEEEFQQACFHISVYKKYGPDAISGREVAQHQLPGGGSMTPAMQ